MGGPLESATRRLFEAIDNRDFEALLRSSAPDVQAVDEISRQWSRGLDALGAYVRQTMTRVTDIHSTINDIHESVHGDIGFITCWLEQDYTLDEKQVHVSAPTTFAFRRDSDGWKTLLIHTVPLPPDEA